MAFIINGFEVEMQETTDVNVPFAHYDGLHPGTTILQKGFRKAPGYCAFEIDTIFERDVEIPMRDGTILRGDIFRPKDVKEKLPAIMAWSPYGKSGAGLSQLDNMTGRMGVPLNRNSGFEKFEAPNPAEWVVRGYAVVNMNARGAFDSQGDIRTWGRAEGQDGYDAVEFIAQQPWCSGKIGFAGNSWLSVVQWFIAAERPPHLGCIAPWEGFKDVYRDFIARGGIPNVPFFTFVGKTLCGHNKREDPLGMLKKYPLINSYWDDKNAATEKIEVPAYVVASSSNSLHCCGSFRAFEEIPHNNKWLRVHETQEWHDLYRPENNDDLQRFYDKFLKGIDNGWESTPRVRMTLLNFDDTPGPKYNFTNWPIPGTKYETLYLTRDNQLSKSRENTAAEFTYQSDVPQEDDSQELSFEFVFPTDTNLAGFSKASLYMSCDDSDDLDVYVQIRKADKNGKLLEHINVPPAELGVKKEDVDQEDHFVYLGPTGILRASHREIDQEKYKLRPHWPIHTHKNLQTIPNGQIVHLEIGIWPAGIAFKAGERLVFKVAGHPMKLPELPTMKGKFTTPNRGKHRLHVGANHESFIVIPVVDCQNREDALS